MVFRAGGGGGSEVCGRVFLSLFHRWCVLCIKNQTKTMKISISEVASVRCYGVHCCGV